MYWPTSTDDFPPDGPGVDYFTPPPPIDDYSPPPPIDEYSPPPPTDDYAPPPPIDEYSPPPPTDDYAPPPPIDEYSPPPPTDDYSPPPPIDEYSPPPPIDDYAPPPPIDEYSPPPPIDAYSPPPPIDNSSPPPPKPKKPPTLSPQTITPPPPSFTPPPSPGGGSSPRVSTGVLIGIAIVSVVAALALVILLLKWNNKRKRRPEPKDHFPILEPQVDHFVTIPHKRPPQTGLGPPSKLSAPPAYSGRETPDWRTSHTRDHLGLSTTPFTYEELSVATNGFSTANFLGKGGFGNVHKGLLPDGQEVAVKQLKTGSALGERDFLAEIEILSRVHHKHLVSLVGYCISSWSERMLVYEFVPNNTLEFHLHGKGRPTMDWHTRLKIALGAAEGLAYLHEDCHPKVIHRGIKPSNILLDSDFEAKVADFGLAKFHSDAHTNDISTRVVGTFGYVAPEYASSGKLTEESDVFSFGVVLLELITGRKAVDAIQLGKDDSLVGWATPYLTRALEDGKFDELVDPRLQTDYNKNEMTRIVACAAACLRHSANHRPRMSQVARALQGNLSLSDLDEGVRPTQGSTYRPHGGSDKDIARYRPSLK